MEAGRLTPATLEDARDFAARMRQDDRNEILAVGGDVEDSVRESIRMSVGDAWVVHLGGEPAAIFGIVPCSFLTGYAVPWLLTTPVVDRYPKAFFRLSRQTIAMLRGKYAVLGNQIDVRYVKSLRWAARLGFTVHEPKPYGPHGAMFSQITMEGC